MTLLFCTKKSRGTVHRLLLSYTITHIKCDILGQIYLDTPNLVINASYKTLDTLIYSFSLHSCHKFFKFLQFIFINQNIEVTIFFTPNDIPNAFKFFFE